MNNIEKYCKRSTLWLVLCLIVVWNVSAWFVSEQYYRASVDELIAQETANSRQQVADLSDSIQRNLNYLHGIPDLLSELMRVKNAVARFGTNAAPSRLPYEERRARWTDDQALRDLSRFLEIAAKSLNADLIYVVDAAGDCIASSNWDTPGASVGSNYAERDFFAMNRKGLRGMQYAMGKTTHIPGLFFSAPVIVDGKFMGAVVAKVDVPNLSFLIKQLDAYVADADGVIILARDKSLEMHAVTGAAIFKEDEQKKLDRYLRSDFPELKIEPWGNARFPMLLRIGGESVPHLQAIADLPGFNLKVYVDDELPAILMLAQDRFWFVLLLGALGSLLILIAAGGLLYLRSVRYSEARLWNQANFDRLTGLPNRDMLQDRLAQEIKKAGRSGRSLALMLIDLDRFKEVNDTLGHEMGDLLLQEAARRMVDSVRETDTVARLGGDEFIVVLPQLDDPQSAENIARKIVTILAEPFQLRDRTAHVSASLGIALYPHDAVDIDHLIRCADQAMYAAKNNGRNNFSFFQVRELTSVHSLEN